MSGLHKTLKNTAHRRLTGSRIFLKFQIWQGSKYFRVTYKVLNKTHHYRYSGGDNNINFYRYLAFLGSLLWNNLTLQVKESQTLEEIKNRIKNLISIHCTCNVGNVYAILF